MSIVVETRKSGFLMVYNSIQCPVCYETMNTNAYILECGHTFCETCILATREYQNACPECRAPVLRGSFIRNGIVSDVGDHLQSLRNETEKRVQDTTDSLMESCRAYVAHIQSDLQRQYTSLLCCRRGDHNSKKRKWMGGVEEGEDGRQHAKRQKTI